MRWTICSLSEGWGEGGDGDALVVVGAGEGEGWVDIFEGWRQGSRGGEGEREVWRGGIDEVDILAQLTGESMGFFLCGVCSCSGQRQCVSLSR